MANDDALKACTVTEGIRFRRAEIGAWQALAPFHYRGGAPRGVSVIFSADYIPARSHRRTRHRWRRELAELHTAAVLVVSRPVPDVRAHNLATHGRYCSQRSRHFGLTRLNQEVRTINRVVVHPQFLGLGLSHRLVRYALPSIGTAYVEAMAAMESVGLTDQQCTSPTSLTPSIVQLPAQ